MQTTWNQPVAEAVVPLRRMWARHLAGTTALPIEGSTAEHHEPAADVPELVNEQGDVLAGSLLASPKKERVGSTVGPHERPVSKLRSVRRRQQPVMQRQKATRLLCHEVARHGHGQLVNQSSRDGQGQCQNVIVRNLNHALDGALPSRSCNQPPLNAPGRRWTLGFADDIQPPAHAAAVATKPREPRCVQPETATCARKAPSAR